MTEKKTIDDLIREATRFGVDAAHACNQTEKAWERVAEAIPDFFLADAARTRAVHAKRAYQALIGNGDRTHEDD